MSRPIGPVYQPDDAGLNVASLVQLAEDQYLPLRESARQVAEHLGGIQAKDIAQLRKQWPAALVRTALVIAGTQAKALGPKGKFQSLGLDWFWSTPEALEQASSFRVALHKTRQMAGLGLHQVWDLCAGIGGDALAWSAQQPTRLVELSPVRAWMAEANLRACKRNTEVWCRDIATIRADIKHQDFILIDPARRSRGIRAVGWQELYPSPAVFMPLLDQARAACIKLSSAMEYSELPGGHLELISDHGSVVQAVLWLGEAAQLLGSHPRRASIVTDDATWSVTGIPHPPFALSEPDAYIGEIDGAVTRAGLSTEVLGPLQAQALTVDGGYCTAPTPIPHPAVTWYATRMHGGADLKKIPGWIADQRLKGCIEVKTRGAPDINTDTLQNLWSQGPHYVATVMIYRRDKQLRAVLAQRLSKS